MSIATDSAINIAMGILDMQETISKHERTIFALGTENEGLKERIESVNNQLTHLKFLLRAQRGMRYEDYNPIAAHLDHTMAIAQGRAPANHNSKVTL